MRRLRRLLIPHVRKSLVPVTILLVPHTRSRSRRVRIPILAGYACFVLAAVGLGFLVRLSLNAPSYYTARVKLRAQVRQMQFSIDSLKSTENEVRGLLCLKPERPPVDTVSNTGDMIDMDSLSRQVRRTIDSAAEVKEYLKRRHDGFLATPAGLPVSGPVTSFFGPRPGGGNRVSGFHHGMDIKASPGTPVRATADGVVSFSGHIKGSGNIVVVEHGYGFSTAYAHAARNIVRVGQQVKRGDVLEVSGSTGYTTGPHVHYEVWKEGTQIDPLSLMTGR
jgi:murein DD-endopeptidase MepM/ murein hydrolase activator NlpD